jgi:hypothetical protein
MPDWSGFVGIDIEGLPKLQEILRKMPEAIWDEVSDKTADLVLNLMQTYEPYRHVSRRQAYPPTGWFSDKQRRFVMAAISEGRITIPGVRTQRLRRGWRKYGEGKNVMIANEVPYATFLYSDTEQAELNKIEGWKTIDTRLKEHEAKIDKTIDIAANKALRRLAE